MEGKKKAAGADEFILTFPIKQSNQTNNLDGFVKVRPLSHLRGDHARGKYAILCCHGQKKPAKRGAPETWRVV